MKAEKLWNISVLFFIYWPGSIWVEVREKKVCKRVTKGWLSREKNNEKGTRNAGFVDYTKTSFFIIKFSSLVISAEDRKVHREEEVGRNKIVENKKCRQQLQTRLEKYRAEKKCTNGSMKKYIAEFCGRYQRQTEKKEKEEGQKYFYMPSWKKSNKREWEMKNELGDESSRDNL